MPRRRRRRCDVMTSAQLRETVQEREKVCVRIFNRQKWWQSERALSPAFFRASARSKSAGCLPSRPKCLPSKKGYAENLPHYPVNIHCKEDLAGNPDWFQNFQPNQRADYPRYFEIEKKDSFWRIAKDFVWTDLRNNPWGVQHHRLRWVPTHTSWQQATLAHVYLIRYF